MTKQVDLSKVVRNGKALNNFLDNYHRMPGGEALIDQIVENEKDQVEESLITDLSWIDFEFGSKDCQEFFEVVQEFGRFDDLVDLVFRETIYCSKKQWETRESELKVSIFLGTAPGISEEIELQAEDGTLVYHYVGGNYFEVWITLDKSDLSDYFFNKGMELIDDLAYHKEYKDSILYKVFSQLERKLPDDIFADCLQSFFEGQRKAIV